MKNVFFYEMKIGRLGIGELDGAITDIFFESDEAPKNVEINETPIIKETANQLYEYFEGKRKKFDLMLAPKGTPFQRKVWQALTTIPYGKTKSYKEIAEEIGNPKASRAVGMANNRNPIAIVVPCHRVIGSNGLLIGYAGGLDIKQQLLELESR